MYIGIVGSGKDPIVQHLLAMIQQKGAEPVLLDSSKYPKDVTLSIATWGCFSNGYDLSDVPVWHVRCIYLSLPVYKEEDGDYALFKDWRARYIAGREQYSAISSWLRIIRLKGKLVVNPVESFDFHFLKPLHIEALRQKGFPLPQTLVTNDPEEVKAFSAAFPSVVYKPLAGGAYCRELRSEDLEPGRLEMLKNAPVIFQERIEGENVRVYVVGEKVVSSAIIHTSTLDYRGNEEEFEEITLPPWVEEMCVKAARASEMYFAGIDLIKGPRGYTILECNPAPIYLGVEQRLGHPISEALINFLMAPQAHGCGG